MIQGILVVSFILLVICARLSDDSWEIKFRDDKLRWESESRIREKEMRKKELVEKQKKRLLREIPWENFDKETLYHVETKYLYRKGTTLLVIEDIKKVVETLNEPIKRFEIISEAPLSCIIYKANWKPRVVN